MRIISLISIICIFAIMALLIFHSMRDGGSNSFELIAHGAGRAYKFSTVDNETLVVYRGFRRRNQSPRGSYVEGFFMDSGRRGMVLEEGFLAVRRREERTLTPEESRELMRLVREVERDAPEDKGFMFSGGIWYSTLRYNGVYYTVPFIAPLSSEPFPGVRSRSFFDDGVSMVDLLNKLIELSPFPVDISRPHGGS